jgi:hypothetical protein
MPRSIWMPVQQRKRLRNCVISCLHQDIIHTTDICNTCLGKMKSESQPEFPSQFKMLFKRLNIALVRIATEIQSHHPPLSMQSRDRRTPQENREVSIPGRCCRCAGGGPDLNVCAFRDQGICENSRRLALGFEKASRTLTA